MPATFSLAYTTTPLAAGVKIAVYATRQLSAGVNRPSQSEYRFIQVSAAAAVSPLDLSTTYVAKFGTLVTGKKVFIRVVPISSSGIRGSAIDTVATVA